MHIARYNRRLRAELINKATATVRRSVFTASGDEASSGLADQLVMRRLVNIEVSGIADAFYSRHRGGD